MHKIDYLNNAYEVTSVSDYMKQINEMHQKEDNIGRKFFFRGQAVDYWDIQPSIFRNNLISIEHSLMAEPKRILPKEFRNLGDSFEIMEKYQHYGLSTRLLDVTSNPLVALYFACEPNDNAEENERDDSEQEVRYPNGIVYYKRTDSVYRYDDSIIKIIAYIAEYNLNEEINMEVLLRNLEIEGFLTKDYSDDNNVIQLIKRLQESYVVLPAINNERLSRQSGAFLLPAKFNFKNAGNNVRNAIIEKSVCSLREEFETEVFYITAENKKKIREELNQIDINEANLFPELEYQLKQIQIDLSQNTKSVDKFEKYIELFDEGGNDSLNEIGADISIIEDIVRSYGFEKAVADAIIKVFEDNNVIDWYRRDVILSKIKVSICKVLLEDGNTRKKAENIASELLKKVIS